MNKQSIHEKITNEILSAINITDNFQMPWHSNQVSPLNAFTHNHYQGINILSLWARAKKHGYESSQWATYLQWKHLGAKVLKGERGSTILLYKPLLDKDGEQIYHNEPPYKPQVLIRSATVFNAQQVSGYENIATKPSLDLTKKLFNVDNYIQNTSADINYHGSSAFYNPKLDIITMPKRKLFIGTTSSTPTEAYYSTLLHELIHWTGHEKRCNRELSGRFGAEAYAHEELTAELGAAFLCSQLGISSQTRPDHSIYISSWIKVLKSNSRAIFLASSKATKAVNYLNQLQ